MVGPFRVMMGMVLLVLTVGAFAQTNVTGHIFGRASLESGEAASSSLVTIVNLQTGATRTLPTREDGNFRFTALPVGEYSILIESAGYQSVEQEALSVNVGEGTQVNVTLMALAEDVLDLGVLEVHGGKISLIDVSSTESTTILTDETIARLPVERDPAKVALLAPGTTLGDRDLGDGPLVSFGGASVAENAFYINGLDVTNFRNGLGGSSVPFEFYQEFQVKTGGYGAEFGRSTGGVINAVTKRGGNEWSFGAGTYYEPDRLRETSPDVSVTADIQGVPYDYDPYNSQDELDILNAHVYGSGPIVRDHLFFYAVVDHNSDQSSDDSGPVSVWDVGHFSVETSDNENTFWGLKLDWQVNANHLVEFTAFSDQIKTATTVDQFDIALGELQYLSTRYTDRGGENYILRYTGHYSHNLMFSALAGRSKYDRTDRSNGDAYPAIVDLRDDAPSPLIGDWASLWIGTSFDEREMYRIDGEWDLNRHLLRFGVDYQQNTTEAWEQYSGGIWWQYYSVMPGEMFGHLPIPEGVTQVGRESYYHNGGIFKSQNTAFYVEDHWQATDKLMLYLGLRNETFDNKNAIGETYLKMSDQLGPRLGFSWDVGGDSRSKLFGTAGRYHLALPSAVSVFASGVLTGYNEWFVLNGLNPDGSPDKGIHLDRSDYGGLADTTSGVARNLDPSYQDEFILGYIFEPAPGWSLGMRAIYRDLQQSIQLAALTEALNRYAVENGFDDYYLEDYHWVLINPGSDVHMLWDMDLDGVPENVLLPAESIGLQKVKRTYKALEIFFNKIWNGTWFLQGSYTYSRNRGNLEGWTESDLNFASPADTTAFYLPQSMEGSDGNLPNDRPHTLKLFGNWTFANRWDLSGNFLFQSGRPYGARGMHPSGIPPWPLSFYDNGKLVPRGSRGRTPNLWQLDLGLQYTLPLNYRNGSMRFRVDVFNVFNSDVATALREETQFFRGDRDLRYLLPNNFQDPRYVRLSARIDF